MAINLDHVTQQLTVTDTAANADLTFVPKGTGAVKATNATNMIVQSIGSSGFGSFLAQGSTGNNAYYFGYSGSSEVGRITMGASNAVDFATSSAATLQLRVNHTASAVNYLQSTGGATGGAPTISAQGSDTNIGLNLTTKGTGGFNFASSGNSIFSGNGGTHFRVRTDIASATGFWEVFGSTAGPIFRSTATTGQIQTSGGTLSVQTDNAGTTQLAVTHTASAVNYIQVSGSVTGSAPYLLANGSDTNVPLVISSKGSSSILFKTAGTTPTQMEVSHTASAVNYGRIVGGATGVAPAFSVQGSDANINLNLVPKGTGNVQQNGTNLALSTHKYHAFTVGTYYYDTYEQPNYFRLFTQNATTDTIRYKTVTSPEYYDYGTSTWTAWTAGQSGIQELLDGNPSTGMNVAHANRTFRFILSGVEGWPTNALVMLQTTWSAVSYTTATVTIATSTVIGGPFTTRQVMVFSSANSGNTWGMHSYYTGSIHTGDTFYQITIDLTDWVDVSTYTTYPLRNLSIFSNYSTAGGIVPYVTTFGKNSSFIGGITTGTDANGTFGLGRYNSSDTNAYFDAIGNASGMVQRVNYWPATRLAYTASSVNYLQFAGSVTGFGPLLSSQGSDTNIPLVLQPKGTGALQAQQTDSTATGGNARGTYAVDWQTVRGTAGQVASGTGAVISGGVQNLSTNGYCTVSGGVSNGASGFAGVVSGGWNNYATGNQSAVSGGYLNSASGTYANISGGQLNQATGWYNFIGNGFLNTGTANAAVTTQSATMNGTTAVTLSGSNASIKVGQYITGTSISGDTYVAAISGTSLTLSKVASGSSTSTLSFYTPHGVVVGGGNNQATGSYSFIGGGGDAGTAGNRNVASGDWSAVAGGNKNVASGKGSFIGSNGGDGAGFYQNTASGTSSTIVCGTNNTVSGLASFIGAGITNNNTGNYGFIGSGFQNTVNSAGVILGGANGNTRSINGNHVFPACIRPIANGSGVSQASLLVLGKQTTDATPTILISDEFGVGTTNQIILPNNSAYFFTGEVVAGVTGGGNTKGWTIEGVIKRGANAASTTLVGTTVTSMYADVGAATWTIAVTADTTNGGLAVTFTGQLATTIRCVAQIRTTEMTF